MIGVPILVTAAVAAIAGHYVLAATLAAFGVIELILWDPSRGSTKDRHTTSVPLPPDGAGLGRALEGARPTASQGIPRRKPPR